LINFWLSWSRICRPSIGVPSAPSTHHSRLHTAGFSDFVATKAEFRVKWMWGNSNPQYPVSRDCMDTPLNQSGSGQTLATLHCVMPPLVVDTRTQCIRPVHLHRGHIHVVLAVHRVLIFESWILSLFYKFSAGDKSRHDCRLSRRIGFSLRKWRMMLRCGQAHRIEQVHIVVFIQRSISSCFFSLVGHGAIAIFLLLSSFFHSTADPMMWNFKTQNTLLHFIFETVCLP
jgi:hypothetical protein